jgi:hypothetical protein
MMWSHKVILTLTILIWSGSPSISQEIKNLTMRIEGDQIMINYDLIGIPTEAYRVTFYSSYDDYRNALTKIAGDVGLEVKAGSNRKAVWNVKEELGEYTGNIQVKVSVKHIPLLEFGPITKIKRGKVNTMVWQSDARTENLEFLLFHGGQMVSNLGKVANSGEWSWNISRKTKPGEGFQIKAIALGRSSVTNEFRISRKIPTIVKILPFLGAGGLVAVLLARDRTKPIPLPLLPE